MAGAFGAMAALTSCAGFSKPAQTNASGELTFTTWGTDSELAGFDRAIAAFQAATPGAKVTLNAVPYKQMFENIDAQLQSGTAPDLFRVDYDNLGSYAGRQQLLDLGPYVDSSLGDTFTDAMWRAVQYNDTPYGVPHHTDTSAILYNKDAFAAAGITSVPDSVESAWTWEEFDQLATTLRGQLPTDRFPFVYNWQQSGVTRWLSWLFEADGRFLSQDLKSPAIDSPEGREAIEFTKAFFPRRLVPENSSVKSATYASDSFFSETAAMTFAGAFLLPDAAKLASFEWGATFSPRHKRGGGDLGGNALVATSQTKQPELAAQFLAFMVEEKNVVDFCTTSSLLPTLKSLVGKPLDFAVRPELSTVFAGQATTVKPEDAAQVASPAMAAINTVLSDQLEQVFVGGQSTDATLKNMTDGIQRAISA